MRVFVANWPRSPLARGQLAWQSLASNTWNVSSTNPAHKPANLLAALPFRCFDQSVMMFVNRMVRPRGIGSSQNAQKIAAAGESCLKTPASWRWRLIVVLKLVRAATVSTPVTFVTFTRLLRISLRALLHKFNLVFFHTFPASFKMPADVDCVYRVCNGQSGCCYLFAQNIHRLNSISEF